MQSHPQVLGRASALEFGGCCCSVAKALDSLRLRGPQPSRPPCPPLSPGFARVHVHSLTDAIPPWGATTQSLTGVIRAATSEVCCEDLPSRSVGWSGVFTCCIRDPHSPGEHRPRSRRMGGPRAWSVGWVGPWLGCRFLEPALSTPLQERAGVHRFQGQFPHPRTSGHSLALA